MTNEGAVNIQIRNAMLADMEHCARIYNDWVDRTAWMRRVHTHKDVLRWLETDGFKRRTVLVAEQIGQVVGYVSYDNAPMITALYVRDGCRGNGVDKQLLDAAKARIAGPTCLWTFVSNRRAQTFYLREGFVEERRTEGDNEEKLPDIFYRWSGPR